MTDKKLDKIVEELSQLTIIESNKLASMLEKQWGVSGNQPTVIAPSNPDNTNVQEEKKTSDVILNSCGSSKIPVIKCVKELCGLGLKDAKDLVDKAPIVIAKDIMKDKALAMKEKLEKAGAIVKLK